VLYRTDANEREIRSAPSSRLVVANANPDPADVEITWYLPAGLDTDTYYRLYRSAATEALLDSPSDELQLVQQGRLTSTDLSNGYVVIPDTTPDSLRGEALYTNQSQEGIANANDLAPQAKDVCLFKDVLFYANIAGRQRLELTLTGAGEESFGWIADNVSTTNASAVVTSVASTTNLRVGMRVKAASGIAGTARILSIDGANQITMTENASASGARDVEFQDVITIAGEEYYAASATDLAAHEFEATIDDTPSVNIDLTARSLVFAVNQNPDQSELYAFYTSSFEEIPGAMLFEHREAAGDSFSAFSTGGTAFSPELPDEAGDVMSTGDVDPSGVAFSKAGEHQAVPLKNKLSGIEGTILRVLALRTGVFVFTTTGIFRIGGTDEASFAVEPFDKSTRLLGPDTAAVLNDSIFAYTNQGVVRVLDGSVPVLSTPIEGELQRVSSDLFPQFAEIAFAVGYESARRYVLFVPDETDDERPALAWSYNLFTSSWTRWRLADRTAGFVNPTDDRLYLADYTRGEVQRERKDFARTDYADREFAVEVVSSDGTEVEVSSAADVAVGQLLVQGYRESLVESIDGTTLTVAGELPWVAGAAAVHEPIETVVEWNLDAAGAPDLFKHYSSVGLVLADCDVGDLTLSFASDLSPNYDDVTVHTADSLGAWGAAPWGEVPWGVPLRGEQIVRTLVPMAKRRCHWLRVRVTGAEPFSSFGLAGLCRWFGVQSERFRGAGAPGR
jgi:hypothetical protein